MISVDEIPTLDTKLTSTMIVPGTTDFTDANIVIDKNLNLDFSHCTEIHCKQIRATDCMLELHNLNLRGSILTRGCHVKLVNCIIHDPPSSVDYLVSFSDGSNVIVENCIFESTNMFGVCVDSYSKIEVSNSTFLKSKYFLLSLLGFSRCTACDCVFEEAYSDALWVNYQSHLQMSQCAIKNVKARALIVTTESHAILLDTKINNCNLGGIFSNKSGTLILSKTHISDIGFIALSLNTSSAAIRECSIDNCAGPALSISCGSKCSIADSKIEGMSGPGISVTDGSTCQISKVDLVNGKMNGIEFFSSSDGSIDDTTISNCDAYGVCVKSSFLVNLNNIKIVNCKAGAIEACDHAKVTVENTICLGPMLFGMNIFTGAHIDSLRTTIGNAQTACVWLHNGGSCALNQTLFAPSNYHQQAIGKSKKISVLLSKLAALDQVIDPHILKIETKRPVVSKKGKIWTDQMADVLVNEGAKDISGNGHEEAIVVRCKKCCKYTNLYFVPCGHSLYCRECWNSFEEKPACCPICCTEIEKCVDGIALEGEDDEIEKECQICFTDAVDTVVLPCGHLICHHCADEWFKTADTCPFCRAKFAVPKRFVAYE